MVLNNSTMNFDKVFNENIDQYSAPVEESEGVTFRLTREEANAIHELLQGEDYGHDAWGPVRTQLDEVVGAAISQGLKIGATQGGKQMAAKTAQAGAKASASKAAMTAAGKGGQFKGSLNPTSGSAAAAATSVTGGDQTATTPAPTTQTTPAPQGGSSIPTGHGGYQSWNK